MSRNMPVRDLRTLGYVLRRTNFGEADRILNVITPEGKLAIIAKGVRKEKSRLAGSIELFSLVELNVHFGKGEMGVLTGAKMKQHFGNIVKDFEKMELAAMILKKISNAAESIDSSEFFKMTDQSLRGLNAGSDGRLVEAWFLLNLRRAMGSELNLYRDVRGEKLKVDLKYDWQGAEEAFVESENGRFGANEIKILRLMMTADLDLMARVKANEQMLGMILNFAREVV